MPAAPIVRTPRLLLRPLRAGDRDAFIQLHEVSRALFEPWSPLQAAQESLEDLFATDLRKGARGRRSGNHLRLVGILDDGRIGGFFNLSEIVRGVFHNAYAGWSVNAEVAGQGIATEGVLALLDCAFAPPSAGWGLHRVQANIIPGNAASLRVAEKAGFRQEGTALRYLKIAGRWQDHLMFAKTVEEHEVVYLKQH